MYFLSAITVLPLQDFAKANSQCPVFVREAYTMIADLAKQGDAGLQKITDAFSLCTPLKSDRVSDFYYVQYNIVYCLPTCRYFMVK